MEEYTRGEYPVLYAVIHEEDISATADLSDGDLVDPSAVQIIVWDFMHNVVQTLDDMTKSSTGIYLYSDYQIAVTAPVSDILPYEYEVYAVDGSSKRVIKKGYFMVKEHIT